MQASVPTTSSDSSAEVKARTVVAHDEPARPVGEVRAHAAIEQHRLVASPTALGASAQEAADIAGSRLDVGVVVLHRSGGPAMASRPPDRLDPVPDLAQVRAGGPSVPVFFTVVGVGPVPVSSDERDPGLRLAPVPVPFTPVRRWVLNAVSELRGLRAGIREEFDVRAPSEAGEPPPERPAGESWELVAVELAANAIQHGGAPTIVELCEHEARFLLTVTDHDLSSEPRVAGYRAPGQGGFGLKIARRLSVDMGWYRTDEVKVVWAELA